MSSKEIRILKEAVVDYCKDLSLNLPGEVFPVLN
jgi:hypothetical protein